MSDVVLQQVSLLPERLGWHILLTLAALAAGIILTIPLAVIALRFASVRGLVLGAASVVQTIPSLALLALMVVLLADIGFWPALIALILYSLLPILRNTVTGIQGVDPALVEAARGVGMTRRQTLLKVQLPLAAPIIIAGIRTSAVWVVGIATLSTPVGQVSLGNYIFEGLQLRNNTAVLVGVLVAASLALLLDGLIRTMEVASAQNSKRWAVLGTVGLCLTLGGGLFPLTRTRPDMRVGSKTFTEQYILADLLRQHLQEGGFRTRKLQGMGSSILFDSLANGSIDCYVDYSGTLWTNVMKRTDILPGPETLDQLTGFLHERYGIVCVGGLGFENAYALAMPRQRAQQMGISTIADLARHAPGLTLAGDYEFFGRPEWKQVRDKYGLQFADTVSLDSTLMYGAVRDGKVDVITAFSSDGRIAAFDLLVLKDPRQAFAPYDAVLLVSAKAAQKPGFVARLSTLVNSIDDQTMREANRQVDLEGSSPAEVAAELLRGQ